MKEWDRVLALLPDEVRRSIGRMPPEMTGQVQELRLRVGQAVSVGMRGRERYITADGRLTDAAGGAIHCRAEWIRQVVDRVCDQSLYAHQEELRCGFLPSPSGCRIGIAGTAITEAGRIVGYRDITSLCIRIAREHRGCAAELAQTLCANGMRGALICGEPSCGKTTLLRDLVREFVSRRLSVAVVDERGELAPSATGCDILRGAPKSQGIEQSIRCLSPQVVVFDELGAAEMEEVRRAAVCGVPIVASAHCRHPHEVLLRDGMRQLLDGGVFPYLVLLYGRDRPGEVKRVIRTEEWLYEMDRDAALAGGGNGTRNICGASSA